MMRSLDWTATMVAALAVAACRPADTTQTASDPSTITSPKPGADTPVWRVVTDSPIVSIGRSDTADYDFTGLQDAAWLGDDRVVVTDASPTPIRVFSLDGKLVAKFPSGHGPAEFGPAPILVEGDSGEVLVWDGANARFGIIDLTSKALTINRQRADPDGGASFARLSGDRWLEVVEPFGPPAQQKGAYRSAQRWVELLPTTGERTLWEFPGSEVTFYTSPNTGGPIAMGEVSVVFGRSTHTAIRRSQLYLAANDAPEVEVRDTGGKLVRRIRVDLPRREVTGADRDRYKKRRMTELEGQKLDDARRARYETEIRETTFGTHFPFFSNLILGRDGTLWLAPFQEDAGGNQEFWIFSDQGRLIAVCSLPADISIMSVSQTTMIGAIRDSLGHPIVRVFPVRQ